MTNGWHTYAHAQHIHMHSFCTHKAHHRECTHMCTIQEVIHVLHICAHAHNNALIPTHVQMHSHINIHSDAYHAQAHTIFERIFICICEFVLWKWMLDARGWYQRKYQ